MSLPMPYYERNGITIYCGDCRTILPGLPKVDLVLTDPPYGVGKAEWDKVFAVDWIEEAACHAEIAMGVMPGISNLLRLPVAIDGMAYKWTLAVRVINACVRGAIGFGNWIPCVIYCRDGKSIYTQEQDAGEVAIRGAMPDHPSPKPYEAMSWFISRLPGDTILDPFLGSGTTAVAAKKLGRKCIGIEIEEKYCEIAAKRLSQEVMNLSEIPHSP